MGVARRAMSRTAATKRWHGKDAVNYRAGKGIITKGASFKGVAEEGPGAYKDVTAVVDATQTAGLARKVVRLEPLSCVKG
jgi:tRNA-splicing ligase RtcB